MKKSFLFNQSEGFSLVEVLLSVSILGLIVTTLVGGMLYGQEASVLSGERARANFLAEEGLEASRNIRDGLFNNLTIGTNGLAISSNKWIFSGSSDSTDIYTRQVQVTPVDVNRRKITSTVTWQQNLQRSGSVSLVTYLTNWRASNGAVVPTVPEVTFNLPGSASGTEIVLYKAGGHTYVVEGRISSADKELYVVNVDTPSVPVITGSLEIGSNVNDLVVVGSNVYLATSDNAAELQVVSLTNPASPTLIGSLNLAGNADAQTIAAAGNNLYIGRISSTDPEIYSISIATPSAPSLLSTIEVGDSVWKIALSPNNSYLYAATGLNSGEFIVVNASNPSSIVQVGSLDLPGTNDGTAVEAFSNYVGLGRDNGSFYIINVTTPSAPSVLGGPLAAGTKINDLTIGPGEGYMFDASGTVGGEITVLDISTLSSPAIFFPVSLSGNAATGLIWDSVSDRVFGSATSNTGELVVIKAP